MSSTGCAFVFRKRMWSDNKPTDAWLTNKAIQTRYNTQMEKKSITFKRHRPSAQCVTQRAVCCTAVSLTIPQRASSASKSWWDMPAHSVWTTSSAAGWRLHFWTWQMARNTGRTWLDCKDPNRADTFLNLAVKVNSAKKSTKRGQFVSHLFLSTHSLQSLEKLYSRLTSRGEDTPSITSSKEDVEKELLRILSCQAESVSCGTRDVQHLGCERLFLWYLAAKEVLFWQTLSVKCETAKTWTGGRGAQCEGKNLIQGQTKKHCRAVCWSRTRGLFSDVQALSQGNHQEAVVHVQRCQELLLRIPKDVGRHSFCHSSTACCCFTSPVHIAV